jgi:hypothetical protein
MTRTRFTHAPLAVAVFVGLLLLSTLSFADSYVRIVRLSDMSGDVEIDRNSGHGFEKALMNMPITQGVRLKTGNNGRAEVEFENGSVIRLVGNSTVGFTALSLRGEGQRLSEMQIGEGTVYVDYRHKGDDDFKVKMGSEGIDLNNKDVRFRVRLEGGQAQVAVFKGELQVQGTPESAKVKKNQTLALDLNDESKYELAKNIVPLATDEYNQQREQYLQLASNRTYGSPYAYGYSDLNRYGSFFNLPGYGLVWQPIGVSMAWDPYSNGYWSMYPGYGYMWVSGYPWGWTPYRYGNWTFASSAGWVWVPGGWNRWNTGVAVTNPPTTWVAPSTPTTAGGGTVIVGNPLPPPMRNIHPTDGSRAGHPWRGYMDDGARARTAPPANGAKPAPSANAAVAATPGAQMQPAKPMAPPAQMNKATRDYESRTQQQRMMRQPMPNMPMGGGSRSMGAPASAPAGSPAAAPGAPASAPAPMSQPHSAAPHKGTNPK